MLHIKDQFLTFSTLKRKEVFSFRALSFNFDPINKKGENMLKKRIFLTIALATFFMASTAMAGNLTSREKLGKETLQ